MINNIIAPDDTRISEIGDFASDAVDFYKNITYHNYTEEVVYIRDRTGVVAKLNPTTNLRWRGESALVVKMQLHMNHVTAQHNYERVIAMRAEDRKFIDKLFLQNYGEVQKRNNQALSITVLLTFNKTQLIGDRGVSYIDITDSLVFIGDGVRYVENSYVPGTVDAAIKRFTDEVQTDPEVEIASEPFFFMVKIVDNDARELPTYWTNIGNRVYSIRAVRDPTCQSGAYVLNREAECNSRSSSLIARFYPLHDFLKIVDFPLYRTHEEAAENPSHPQVKNWKEAMNEQAAKTAKAEAELRGTKERQEQEKAKFNQEMRNNKRKNTFELFKYGPMIINGLIALTMIILSVVTKTPVKVPPIKV